MEAQQRPDRRTAHAPLLVTALGVAQLLAPLPALGQQPAKAEEAAAAELPPTAAATPPVP